MRKIKCEKKNETKRWKWKHILIKSIIGSNQLLRVFIFFFRLFVANSYAVRAQEKNNETLKTTNFPDWLAVKLFYCEHIPFSFISSSRLNIYVCVHWECCLHFDASKQQHTTKHGKHATKWNEEADKKRVSERWKMYTQTWLIFEHSV